MSYSFPEVNSLMLNVDKCSFEVLDILKNVCKLLDPDPYFEYGWGSGSLFDADPNRILTRNTVYTSHDQQHTQHLQTQQQHLKRKYLQQHSPQKSTIAAKALTGTSPETTAFKATTFTSSSNR